MIEGKDERGRYTKGNRFWQAQTKYRDPIFKTPEELWAACLEYFEWVVDNPLHETRPINAGGKIEMVEVPKMRAMTDYGLCTFLGISRTSWFYWRKERDDLKDVIEKVEAIIRDYKFTGAAAELLNPGIIARDLGLADKTDLTNSDGTLSAKTDEELKAELAALRQALEGK